MDEEEIIKLIESRDWVMYTAFGNDIMESIDIEKSIKFLVGKIKND